MARGDLSLSSIEVGYELCAVERQATAESLKDTIPVELIVTQKQRSYMVFSSVAPITQSRIVLFNTNLTPRQIKKRIFKLFRPVIQAPSISHLIDRNHPNYNEETILNEEFKHFFENPEAQEQYEDDGENIDNALYKIQIYNNQQTQSGMFFTYRKPCEFCGREHKDNCDFEFANPKIKLKEIIRSLKERDLHIVVHWRQNPSANMQMLEKPHIVSIDQTGMSSMKVNAGSINLYDCLNYFSVEETLRGDDKWYCGKCKDHVNA